jgi:hypothetical protein
MKILGKKKKRTSNKSEATFLLKLFTILNNKDKDKDKDFSKYIYWSKDGLSIIIPNQNNFTKNVLPKFCNTKNFSSFVRQLNMYHFKKIKTKNRTEIKYKHSEFNKFKTEEEIKLIKKNEPDTPQVPETIPINENSEEINNIKDIKDKQFVDTIENLDEETKIKEYEKILKKGKISNLQNEKMLNYLLEKSKENIESKKYIEEEMKEIVKDNNILMEKIEIYNNKFKKMNLLLAYLISLIMSKKNFIEKEEKEEKKKNFKIFMEKLKKYKKSKIVGENIENKNLIKNSNLLSRNSSIIVNDINFVIDQDIFNNNNKYHNNENNNYNNNEMQNISILRSPSFYYDFSKNLNLRNSLNSSHFLLDKTNNNLLKNSLNSVSNTRF